MNGWLGRWREREREERIDEGGKDWQGRKRLAREEKIGEGGKDGKPSIYPSSSFVHSFIHAKGQGEVHIHVHN